MIDKRIRIGLALVLFSMALFNIVHAFNLMDSGNVTMRGFGQLNFVCYAALLVAAILLFMKKKAGLLLGYGALLLMLLGLTDTSFYNWFGSGESFWTSLGMLDSRDYLWIAFNSGVILFIGFVHMSWESMEPPKENRVQNNDTAPTQT